MSDQSHALVVLEPEDRVSSNISVRRQRSRLRIAERDQHAQRFITKAEVGGGFIEIRQDLVIKIRNDDIRKINLIINTSKEAKDLFARLNASAEQYFAFPKDFFEFYNSEDRTFRDLFRRPFTLGDLEEHKAEEQFPDDIEPRALMKALNIVIEKNQWTHIFQKRVMQLAFCFVAFILILLWLMLAQGVTRSVASWLSAVGDAGQAAGVISSFLFVLYIVLIYGPISLLLKKLLGDQTTIFRLKNQASCRQVIAKMSLVNNWLREVFYKLVGSDVEDNQDNYDVIIRGDWSDTAAGVFRIAMWCGKRIESLERFWEMQFERLRVFEMSTERLGNLSSLLVWSLSTVVAVSSFYAAAYFTDFLGLAQFAIACIGYAVLAWRFGATTRRGRYSFGMDEIAREQFNENWRGFSELGYYGKIAALYKAGKDAIRTEVRSKHPGAVVRG